MLTLVNKWFLAKSKNVGLPRSMLSVKMKRMAGLLPANPLTQISRLADLLVLDHIHKLDPSHSVPSQVQFGASTHVLY